MSDSPESTPPLDLSDLRLMPKWVAEFGKASPSPAADYSEEDTRGRDRRDGRGPRDQQRRSFGGGGGGQGGPPRGDRRPFDKPRGPGGDHNRGPRPPGAGDRRDDRRGGGGGGYRQDRGDRSHGGPRGGRDDRRGGYGDRPRFEQQTLAPVTGLTVHVEPEAKATEAMAAMIRTAGKAYSVFDAARLVLASGDRFHVRFKMAPDANAKLYAVPTDGSLWLSREEALTHVIHGDAISSFYKVEEVELEEPKGNFTSVAVCGMTGQLLGPPSHHSYQTTLHKIHREQFSHLPFEDYKRRVRTESTPEAVQKWKDAQKHGQQWTWLKSEVALGEEPKTFKTRSEMEAHFRANHAETLVGEVSEATVSGNIPKKLLAPQLYNHLRRAVDESRKHLLGTAQQLCSGFERHGLKLFKRRGGKLWVSRTRPRLLENSVVLSARIAKMVEIIKTQPGIQVKKLIETVAPSTDAPATAKAPEPAPSAAPAPAPLPAVAAPLATEEVPIVSEPAVVAEALGASAGTALPPIELAPEQSEPEASVAAAAAPEAVSPEAEAPVAEEAKAVAETPVPAPIPVPAPASAHHEWTGDQLHALQDLHWLNSEGYVIEYADGVVFPGVTEPPPPKPKATPAKAAAAAGEATATAPEASEAPVESEAETSMPAGEESTSAPEATAAEVEAEAPASPAEEVETDPHGEAESILIEAAAETEAPVEVEAAVTAPEPEAASDEPADAGVHADTEVESAAASSEEEK